MSSQKELNFVSAVVYVRNAEKTICDFLSVIRDYLYRNFNTSEIVCVNDDSSDDSLELIRQFARSNDGDVTISILNMSYYQGLELSMNAGIDLAIGDYVYEFDNTIVSFAQDLLADVYECCINGADIVSATPLAVHHRASNVFYRLYNHYSRSPHDLGTEGFRMLSRRAINRVRLMSETLPYRKAVYANAGLNIDTIHYTNIVDVAAKRTKEEKTDQIETAQNALLYFTDAAYKATRSVALIFIAVFLAVAIYAIIVWCCGQPVAGWTATTLLICFGFCGIGAILLALVKYQELILRTVFTKNKYLIRSIEKLNYGDE